MESPGYIEEGTERDERLLLIPNKKGDGSARDVTPAAKCKLYSSV